MSKCKTVTLRKRKIKNGTQYSLCLDYTIPATVTMSP